jgi:peptidoglycan/LPS O-acetylase OafA/YrhL
MKFKVLAVFSVVLIILGVASLGTMLQDLSRGVGEDTYLGTTMAVWFIAGGALLYWAAGKCYSVGWRMYLGAFLTFFGFIGASIEADSIVNLRAREPVFGFVLAAVFVVSGCLLARSGYRRDVKRSSDQRDRCTEAAAGWSGVTPASATRVARSEEVVAAIGSVRKE